MKSNITLSIIKLTWKNLKLKKKVWCISSKRIGAISKSFETGNKIYDAFDFSDKKSFYAGYNSFRPVQPLHEMTCPVKKKYTPSQNFIKLLRKMTCKHFWMATDEM